MSKSITVNDRKTEANRLVSGAAPVASQGSTLLDEFSQLLDKIASHIGTANDRQIKAISELVQAAAPQMNKVAAPTREERPIKRERGDMVAASLTSGSSAVSEDSHSAQDEVDASTEKKADTGTCEDSADSPQSEDETKDSVNQVEECAVGVMAQAKPQSQAAATENVSQEEVVEEDSGVVVDDEAATPEGKPQQDPLVQYNRPAHLESEGGAKPAALKTKQAAETSAATQDAPAESGVVAPTTQDDQSALTDELLQRIQLRLKDQNQAPAAQPKIPAWTPVEESIAAQNVAPAGREALQGALTMKAPLEEMVMKVAGARQGAPSTSQQSQGDAGAMKRDERAAQSEETRARPLTNRLSTQALERVEQALKEIARSKDGKTISVRLDPSELGSVKVDITLKDGALHARLTAEASQVTQLLRERSSDLQATLRKLGLQVDSVTVSVVSDDAQRSLSDLFGGTSGQGSSSYQPPSTGSGLQDVSVLGGAISASIESGITLDHWVA